MHAVALIVVSSMVVEGDASLRIVARVPKEAQTSARPMVGEKDALGGRVNVRNLQGAGVVCVLLTAVWCKTGRQAREGSLHLVFSTGLYQQHQP